jgi:hypothetical protein
MAFIFPTRNFGRRDGVQDGLGLLEEIGLVGRAAALGDEQEAVLVAVDGREVDLGRQVRARVLFLVHRQGRVLGVAQEVAGVGVEDAPGQGSSSFPKSVKTPGPSWR